jgi:hypothetical protein
MMFKETNKKRMYRIICLKRSNFDSYKKDDFISEWYKNSKLVYWRANYSGYTQFKEEAGLYSAEELDGAGGSWGDWLVEPVWIEIKEEI